MPEVVKAIGIPNKRYPNRPPILKILTPPRDGKIAFPIDFTPEIDKEYKVEIIFEKENYAKVRLHKHFFVPDGNPKFYFDGIFQKLKCYCGEEKLQLIRSFNSIDDIFDTFYQFYPNPTDDDYQKLISALRYFAKHHGKYVIPVILPKNGFGPLPDFIYLNVHHEFITFITPDRKFLITDFDDINGYSFITNLDEDEALRLYGILYDLYNNTIEYKMYMISKFYEKIMGEEKKWQNMFGLYRLFNVALKTQKIYHYKIKFYYQSKPQLKGKWPYVYTSRIEEEFEFDVYLPAKIEEIKAYIKRTKKIDEGEHASWFEPLISSFDIGAKLEINPVLVEEIPFDPLNPIFEEKIYRIGLKNIMIYKNGYYFDIHLDIPKIELDEEYTLPDPEFVDLLLNQYLIGNL